MIGRTAWAQTIGISKVEVEVDDEPWQKAELAEEATLDTWRQWRYVWKGGSFWYPLGHRARLQRRWRNANQ